MSSEVEQCIAQPRSELRLKILFEVFGYITEKRYDSSTGYMFFNAFLSIFKTKVVITYANKMKEDTVIESNFLENKISIFKCQEHFDLLRTPEPATTSNISSE